MEELLVQVDENDNEIGSIARAIANEDPSVYHRHAVVLLFNDHNQVLIGKRSKRKEFAGGKWMIVGGHVKAGQTTQQAAEEELFEEVGIRTKLVFAEKIKILRERESQFSHLFIGKIDKLLFESIKVDEDEFSEMKLINKEDLYQLEDMGGLTVRFMNDFWDGKFTQQIQVLI